MLATVNNRASAKKMREENAHSRHRGQVAAVRL